MLIKNKHWAIFFALLIILALISMVSINYLQHNHHDKAEKYAKIFVDKECVKVIDLNKVTEDYSFEIKSGDKINTVMVSKGKICIHDANCPDKLCVNQGWIENGVVPIVCLPNKVVIQIDDKNIDNEDAIDTIAQ